METSERLTAPSQPALARLARGWRLGPLAWDVPTVFAVPAAMLAGLLVRLAHVLPAGFPLNDGGLFYVMGQDLQRAGYALPDFASYNSAHIPFAYPPLPFYLAALVDEMGPWDLLDVVRFLPLVFSVLTIPAFFLLSRAMLPSRFMAVVAMFAFAVLPRAFNWEIVGGGLTRSLGFLLAILALHQGYLMYTRRRSAFALSGALLAALAILSHPEMGWFVAYSFAIFFVAQGRNAPGIRNTVIAAAVALALTAPWWGTIVARHGVSTLLSAAQAGRESWYSWGWARLLRFDFTEEPFLPLLAALGLLGIAASIADRRFLLPVWLAAMFLLDPRKAATNAMVPLAMLIAVALTSVVLPNLRRTPTGEGRAEPVAARASWPRLAGLLSVPLAWLAGLFILDPRAAPTSALIPLALLVGLGVAGLALPGSARANGNGARALPAGLGDIWRQAALALLLAYGIVSAVGTASSASSPLHTLSPERREAMQWAASHTPTTSAFLVVKGPGSPWIDATSEWFPALTGRKSLATVQGYEWLGKATYERQQDQYHELQACAFRTPGCLKRWADHAGVAYTHVFLPKGVDAPSERSGDCCAPLREALRHSPRYSTVYDGPGATIFALRAQPLGPLE